MRRLAACLTLVCALVAPASAGALDAGPLRSALDRQMARAGSSSGAYVQDLSTSTPLYARRADTRRIPASVEKLYTTSTALVRFGPDARLHTSIYATGAVGADGTWRGNLYLKGFGDPTFGSSSFVRRNYGTGGTMAALADAVVEQTGLRRLTGGVYGDESYFDTARGGAYTTGRLSALAFNRGLTSGGAAYLRRPAGYAAGMLAEALRARGVRIGGAVSEARTPPAAEELTQVESPDMATLARLTNRPSDNFFAEMLLKGLGAQFGAGGTTAAGAAVVRTRLVGLGIAPSVVDGSGLSRSNRTTPRQLVRLLAAMRTDSAGAAFFDSLAVAGRSGTVAGRMRGTAAQDRCHTKTGTLSNVSALAGYCVTRHRHTLAFAIIMNRVSVGGARSLQDRMAAAIASYSGGGPAPVEPPVTQTPAPTSTTRSGSGGTGSGGTSAG